MLPIEVSVENLRVDIFDDDVAGLTFNPFFLKGGLEILRSVEKLRFDTESGGWITDEQGNGISRRGEAKMTKLAIAQRRALSDTKVWLTRWLRLSTRVCVGSCRLDWTT